MRIHSDVLTYAEIEKAARKAAVDFDVLSQHGSRKKARAYEIKLLGESPYRPNGGTSDANPNGFAASYDQWGIFLAALYAEDSDMVCPYYRDNVTFHDMHFGRYLTLTAAQTHRRHKWNYSMSTGVHECECGAARDFSIR
jgi:hypothetical protein